MTKNITVRSQLTVNFKAYIIIWFKCASVLHLQVSYSTFMQMMGYLYASEHISEEQVFALNTG